MFYTSLVALTWHITGERVLHQYVQRFKYLKVNEMMFHVQGQSF